MAKDITQPANETPKAASIHDLHDFEQWSDELGVQKDSLVKAMKGYESFLQKVLKGLDH